MSMNFGRRELLIATVALPTLSWAQSGRPTAGKEYVELKPAEPTDAPAGKIAVIEFFWYGCPHCAAFAPELDAWRKKLPADVAYFHSPVAFSDAQTPHSKIYYTLEALGKAEALDKAVFDEIVVNRKPLLKPDDIADFMAAHGIDRKTWVATFNSFTIVTKSNRAAQMWRAYKIDGTPSVGIDGRYVTSPAQANGRPECLKVMDFLIEKVRADRGAGAKK
jgi:thiol:disulfide interchange protein DsbA